MRNSIRTRLTVAFISLAVCPLLLVGAVLAWQSFATQQQQALNWQREMARRVAAEVAAFFEGLENELRLVSKAQVLPGISQSEQHNILILLMSQDIFDDLVLLDSEGREQIHLSRLSLTQTVLGDRAGADEFVIPHTTGEVYYSPVRFDEITGEPLMTIAVPMLDVRTGLTDGVLASEVRVKKIWDLIADVRVSQDQSVYIVDAQNRVVAHRNPSVVLRGTRFDVPDQDGIQPGLTGSNAVLAVETTRFGQQEFNIVAEQAVSEALALAVNAVVITATLVVAALAVSTALGLLIVRQIVRPIRAMATTAQAISAGDLSQQVQVTSRDEVGLLALAFNDMTTQLRALINNLERQITDRKRAEEALRESEERLRQIASSLREAIWLRDVQTRQVLYVNPAFEELTGWTCESFYENRDIVIDAIHPDDKEWVIKALDQRFEDVPFDKEHRIIHLDGSVRWISSRSFPVRNEAGEVYRWASIMEDITERKRAEEALIRERDLLHALMDNIPDTIYFKDVTSCFTRINRAQAQVLGVNDPREAVGKTDFDFFTPEHARDAYADEQEIVKSGQPLTAKVERIQRSSGQWRWVSVTKVPIRDKEGQVVGIVGISRDITEHKQAEEEIRRLNEELEQRVIERTAQLEAANKELEAFAYSVSHDLRAPLRHIEGFVRLLREREEGQLDPTSSRYLNIIAESSNKMDRLIDDLLAFSRTGRTEMRVQRVELDKLVREAQQELASEMEGRRITWEVSPLPVVEGDPILLQQVWVNLLSNAIKFTAPRAEARIEIGVIRGSADEEGEVIIYVRDNGVGFDPQYAHKLFGVFQRLHREDEFEGSGIGLATVRRIIHRHGGRVWAEGEPDHGATFYFTLREAKGE